MNPRQFDNKSTTASLEARKLCRSFGNTMALRDLSFSVHPGEIFCLLGQNGAGKTTTINIFLGLLKPTSGDALINSVSILNRKSAPQALAYIPEVVQLYGNLSGTENLDFFSRLAGYRYTKDELQEILVRP